MNGHGWSIKVAAHDSPMLVDRTGHCAIYSFGLAYDIHKMVRQEYWMEAEEWVCNFIADYWLMMFQMLLDYLGEKAWNVVSKAIETTIVNRYPYTIYRR